MPRPSREMPLYDDLDPLPGQRLPWELPWEPDGEEESRMETDPGQMPDDDEDEEDDTDDTGGGTISAVYPPSDHLFLR